MSIWKRVKIGLLCAVAGGMGLLGRAVPLDLTYQPGEALPVAVARPFAGKVGEALLLGGGSTFEGGKKEYSAALWRYEKAPAAEGEASSWRWQQVGALPEAVAEGGAVAVNVGSALKPQWRLVCVGGVGAQGATDKAFVLDASGKAEALPPCPAGTLSMTAAVPWEGGAAFVGGLLNGQPTNRVLTLKCVEGQWVWGELPAFPGPARSQAVAAVQNGDHKQKVLVVYGGTITGEDGKPMAAYDGYGYTKGADGHFAWQVLKAAPVSTIGAGLVPVGDQHLLLIGGYNGQMWDRANRMLPADWQRMLGEAPAAFGWNRKIYAYHVVTGQWCEYGELPAEALPRCGAAVVELGGQVVIAAGEIKPAKRTGEVLTVGFKRKAWRFSAASWGVIVLFFFSMAGMGVYFALKPKTADNYFRGGKSIPWYVAGVSIYATMLSSITFISVPAMTYLSDWRYFTMTLCTLALAPIAIRFYLPFFCRLNITSAYEYLEKRFNVSIRLFGATVFNIFMICRVAVVTLLPALALGAVTGMPIWLAIVLCGVATIIYCFFGGVEAVIWSDFVQGLILLFGAIVVLVWLIASSGGVSDFSTVAWTTGKLKMWDFRVLFSEPVFWVVLIMGFVENLNSYTADQCVVQRYITCPNEKAAARSIWFNGFLSVGSSVIFYLIGSALYTHYIKHPEMMDITMPKNDSVFPLFMAIELHPILSGLIVAAVFAATISTLSTNLNSSATSIVTDFLARFRKDMDGAKQVFWGRICVVIVGVLGVAAALVLAQMPSRSLFDIFKNFIGTLTGGLSALFLMGVFMPRVSGAAAFIALVVNYVVSLGIGCLFPKLHSFTYGGIALVVCVVVAYILSFVFPNRRPAAGLTLKTLGQRPTEE